MNHIISLIAAATLMVPSQVQAQDAGAGVALDAFYGTCLNSSYRAVDHAAFAKLANWPELPIKIITLNRPPSDPEIWEGWFASSPDDPSFFFASFAGSGRDGTQICGAMFRHLDAAQFVSLFEKETSAVKIDEDYKLGVTRYAYKLADFPALVATISFPRGAQDVQAFTVSK